MKREDLDIVAQKVLYQGHFSMIDYSYRHKKFMGGWSEVFQREVFERGNGVGVLLYDPKEDKVILIEQCRPGPFKSGGNPWLLEIVAGECEPSESLREVAVREVQEEAGMVIDTLVPIGQFYLSPGCSSEQLALFCARVDSQAAGGIHGLPSEHEDIKVHVLSCDEAMRQITSGSINTAPAVIALQWLQLNKHNLWQEHHDG